MRSPRHETGKRAECHCNNSASRTLAQKEIIDFVVASHVWHGQRQSERSLNCSCAKGRYVDEAVIVAWIGELARGTREALRGERFCG